MKISALLRSATLSFCMAPAAFALGQPGDSPKRGWTVADIVEVSRITSVAVSQDGRRVAYIVKQPVVKTGEIGYALYVVDRSAPGMAMKIVESSFLDDVSAHPGTTLWTLRAEFGAGVQVYDVADTGAFEPLVVSTQTALVGGNGVIRGIAEGPQNTGVLSYEWAPDGAHLWYARLRLNSDEQRLAMLDRGMVYDDRTMMSFAFQGDPTRLAGTELHVRSADGSQDRLVASAPTDMLMDMTRFTHRSVSWSADSTRIQYSLEVTHADGEREFQRWSVDARSAEATRIAADALSDVERAYAVPTADGRGFLSVAEVGDERRLRRIDSSGKVTRDYGRVDFTRIGVGSGAWWHPSGKRALLAVHYRDHDGLASFPSGRAGKRLAAIPDHLSECTFTRDLDFGACVRESLALAPELVGIDPHTGSIVILARPNARFDEIEPLRSERREWTNRFGSISDGYITYPRHYQSTRKYPVIVVTHGSDAQNRFAYEGFQWSFPVQVWAERGYIVLSVNDPRATSRTHSSRAAFMSGTADVDVAQMQFYKNVNPLAGLEAALQSVIDRGIANPEQTGIAGYSRGTEMVEFALSHSRMFKAGIDGDAGGWNPGVYWAAGTVAYRALFWSMYGGSAYDPANLDSYLRYSPAFRAREFAGPLLQLFSSAAGVFGLELNALLRDADVPTELVTFPNETHLFWQPRHREAAMIRSLDWFDYWLLDKRTTDSDSAARYARWDRMAKRWRSRGE